MSFPLFLVSIVLVHHFKIRATFIQSAHIGLSNLGNVFVICYPASTYLKIFPNSAQAVHVAVVVFGGTGKVKSFDHRFKYF